jgi:hypothetical protein
MPSRSSRPGPHRQAHINRADLASESSSHSACTLQPASISSPNDLDAFTSAAGLLNSAPRCCAFPAHQAAAINKRVLDDEISVGAGVSATEGNSVDARINRRSRTVPGISDQERARPERASRQSHRVGPRVGVGLFPKEGGAAHLTRRLPCPGRNRHATDVICAGVRNVLPERLRRTANLMPFEHPHPGRPPRVRQRGRNLYSLNNRDGEVPTFRRSHTYLGLAALRKPTAHVGRISARRVFVLTQDERAELSRATLGGRRLGIRQHELDCIRL